MAKEKKKPRVEIRNKKAGFEYEFIETFTAGIVLWGTEIKSIREGKASLVDSWCYFVNGELYVKNMNVAEYWWGSAFSRQDPKRDRKLLLTRKELRKLARAVKEKGLTIVATRLFIAENGYAKLNIALARGKREFDKRESIKEKDLRRDLDLAHTVDLADIPELYERHGCLLSPNSRPYRPPSSSKDRAMSLPSEESTTPGASTGSTGSADSATAS